MLSPSKLSSTLDDYCQLAATIKLRFNGIAAVNQLATEGRLHPGIAHECFQLQLRMIYETIALSCLIAHRDLTVKRSGRLDREYSAKRLLNRLEKLHPDFFPWPVAAFADEQGKRVDVTSSSVAKSAPAPRTPINKKRLIYLIGRCGDNLHAGTLKRMYSSSTPTVDFRDVQGQLDDVKMLLANHKIVLADRDWELWIQMDTPPDKKVCGAAMRRFQVQ